MLMTKLTFREKTRKYQQWKNVTTFNDDFDKMKIKEIITYRIVQAIISLLNGIEHVHEAKLLQITSLQ